MKDKKTGISIAFAIHLIYNEILLMAKQSTTIRLDEGLRKGVMREAQRMGLSFSSVVHLLLGAYAQGEIHIGATQYPKAYLNTLDREAGVLRRLHRNGKTKRYSSSKALFDDILDR